MKLTRTIYIVQIKGLDLPEEFKSIEGAFEFIKTCMPCEATISTREE